LLSRREGGKLCFERPGSPQIWRSSEQKMVADLVRARRAGARRRRSVLDSAVAGPAADCPDLVEARALIAELVE
jgi:hypothetical protein